MLSKMIVGSLESLIEVCLWIFLLFCLVAGAKMGGGTGAIVGLIVGFVFAVMFFGGFLVLLDIRKSVRTIELKHKS